jgi:hypothetical protein
VTISQWKIQESINLKIKQTLDCGVSLVLDFRFDVVVVVGTAKKLRRKTILHYKSNDFAKIAHKTASPAL